MALDPTKHADWEIAEDSEKRMKPIAEIAEKMGLTKEELIVKQSSYGDTQTVTIQLQRKDGVSNAN